MARLFFALAAFFVLAGAAAAHAEARVVQFHSGEGAPDLDCPPRAVPPPSTAPPSYSGIPFREELGPLATLRIREQPPLHLEAFDRLRAHDVSPGRPLRIGIWGDSHIAAGPFAETLRGRIRALGYRPVTRFIPPSMGRANVRLGGAIRAYCLGEGWSSDLAFRAGGPIGTGPGLMTRKAEAGAESRLAVDFRIADRSRLKEVALVYSAPRSATLALSVNGAPEQTLVLAATYGGETLRIRNDGPVETLGLRVIEGGIELHGFRLEEADPSPVVLDVFGLPSSTVAGWAQADPRFMSETLGAEGDYDAVVLEYGTNEGAQPGFDIGAYRRTLRQALVNLRTVFPKAACVLMGPPDRGELRTSPSQRIDLLAHSANPASISAAQEEIAPEFGCAFWNWNAFMGGPGGGYGWVYAEPPLMARDLTHLTADGYRLTAEALAKSLGF